MQEIKETTEAVYGKNSLKKTQIYGIIRAVKEGKDTVDQQQNNERRKVRSFVTKIAVDVEIDRHTMIRKLAATHGMCTRTIQLTLHEDLDLSKKSARWVPKLLTSAHKEERIRTCKKFLAMVHCRSVAMLDSIVSMDKSAVSFLTPESKMQSKQWTKKGLPGPVKAKVHAIRSKQMVLAFFNNEGLIYANYVPKGQMVNVNCVVEALRKFLAVFKKKRPNMAAGEWFRWMVAKDFRLIKRPPYLPDLAPADLFPNFKRQLAGKTLTYETFKSLWEGAARTIIEEDFSAAFRHWYESLHIGGRYVEKS